MLKSIKILYEDECLIVFDKPPGLLTVPSPKKEKKTLLQIVNQEYPAGDQVRWHPCHRLDRDTSGAIIFARGKKNQQLMMQEFHQNAVQKKYIAFVRGCMKRKKGTIRSVIRDAYQQKFSRHAKGKLAITKFIVRAVKKKFSVVEIFPQTGRTNQIRIHFCEIGYPLLGERLYALGRDASLKFRRIALHASQVNWRHPVYKKPIKVVAPLPGDMEIFLNRH